MQVHQILKSKGTDGVFTVKPGTKVADAARILAEKRIGTVVVSPDGKKAVGILSERDIVRELAVHGGACLDASVETYMTPDLVTCTREDPAEGILAKMTEGRFRHMPVIEDGQLVGLVTLGDVVKARMSELSAEKDALEDMISNPW
ncbi:CBS domain-containing protein [Mameliella sediminis]|uniref:CBS domain-containing protein n=1 Tax=Mameliella sediminis TaxID=2836866 RepID=UPI001C44DCAF|nr:CBS domain-containing protein [Mameliella sediminis]MBV7392923.1 CBS domain-containing protein [Mameliella sediminis]MBY6114596.1 CBS domain-containing protein [Antarctobacter heliothermus]MBY6144169.1 CBS domain-containing protein [Mameliella alba]MCA0954218.1 CBS domain-containing protein [Mameliella alba]